MKQIPRPLWITAVVIASLVLAWNIVFPTNSFRYKVTVNVETPEGIKSGSAVREFTVVQQPEIGDSGPGNSVRGEAVVVDLGARGVLFALIDMDDEYMVFRTFPSEQGGLTRAGARYYERLEAKATLDPANYPKLVAFKDINDPGTVYEPFRVIFGDASQSSIERNKVQRVEDNLAATFGEGVRLKNITIEMTDEPVTDAKVEKHMPWVQGYPEEPIIADVSMEDFSLKALLRKGHFNKD
jgi:hypothetical protein